MSDILKRYFIGNSAPIFSVKRAGRLGFPPVRCRCGNADGWFVWGWLVVWRTPYSDVWAWHPTHKRWVYRYTMEQRP